MTPLATQSRSHLQQKVDSGRMGFQDLEVHCCQFFSVDNIIRQMPPFRSSLAVYLIGLGGEWNGFPARYVHF